MEDNHNAKFLKTKYHEKSFGLTPAELLIVEIKKPKRPIIQKSQQDSILRKNSKNYNKNTTVVNNSDDNKYKDPKVRLKNILYII